MECFISVAGDEERVHTDGAKDVAGGAEQENEGGAEDSVKGNER